MNYENYRESTQYQGVFKYIAPNGYVWESCGTLFGKIIYGGETLNNPYVLKKIE